MRRTQNGEAARDVLTMKLEMAISNSDARCHRITIKMSALARRVARVWRIGKASLLASVAFKAAFGYFSTAPDRERHCTGTILSKVDPPRSDEHLPEGPISDALYRAREGGQYSKTRHTRRSTRRQLAMSLLCRICPAGIQSGPRCQVRH